MFDEEILETNLIINRKNICRRNQEEKKNSRRNLFSKDEDDERHMQIPHKFFPLLTFS